MRHPEILFDDTYLGARHTYGMKYRPLQIGAQPRGWIVGSDRKSDQYTFGTIQYPRALSPDELRAYELEEIKP